jgi:PmbA protein
VSPAAQVDSALEEVLVALTRQGLTRAEVYAKRGRSRRLELGPGGETASFHEERGWAVRAGTGRGAFFTASTGEPDPGATWPAIDGPPLELPEAAAPAAWSEPSDFETPLVGESEGLRLLAGLARELESELPGARLLTAVLEDGSSEAELASSRGVRARVRGRAAALRLEAALPARGAARDGVRASVYIAAREARRFAPSALARRLADALSVRAGGAPPPPESGGELLLAPAVGARLLAALLPLFVGPEAPARTAALRDRQGRLGAVALTLIDDGRLPGGVFEAAVDGEGVPCRAATLVERGVFRGPLLAWRQARSGADTAGCSRRPSWRDLPAPGPTHLYVQPDPKLAVAALLGGIDRGAYLIEPTGAPRIDWAGGRFALPVCGLAVAGGRAEAPLAGAWLSGEIAALLQGVRAAARDLTFFPYDGMLGAPTLLVTGLELR